MSFSSTGSVAQNIKGGKLSLLAVCSSKRLSLYPNAPAIAETLPGYDMSTWYGLAGPAKLPRDLVARLNAEVNRIVQLPDVAQRFKDLSEEPGKGTPEQFAQFWKGELDKYGKLMRDAKISNT
jgi:tripartite-type tricarboxylate transporter receptor subunit TctC